MDISSLILLIFHFQSEIPGDDHTIPYEPEPETEELTYNYNALRWACNKNMSLWRSHTDSKLIWNI